MSEHSSWMMRSLSERNACGLDTVVHSRRQMLLSEELRHSQVNSSGEMAGTTEGPAEMWRTVTQTGPSARETRKKAGMRRRYKQMPQGTSLSALLQCLSSQTVCPFLSRQDKHVRSLERFRVQPMLPGA